MNLLSKSVLYKPIVDALDRALQRTESVVSGCAPTATGNGLQINVAAGVVRRNGGLIAAWAGGNTTLANADNTNPRVDIVYIDSAGALQNAAGQPLASQPIPAALPAGAVLICTILVTAQLVLLTASNVNDARMLRDFASGTAASPSAMFAADGVNASGFFRAALNAIGVAIAGIEKHRFHASGGVSIGDAIDPGTGILRAALALVVGANPAGSGAIRITSGGTIVGRNNPNTADMFLLSTDAADNLRLAAGGAGANAVLILASGGNDRWKIDGVSGHLLASVDNTEDIGAAGATRPRTAYIGTSVIVGGTALVVPAAVKVYNGAAQVIGTGANTVLAFDSEDLKTVASMHNNAANNSRVVAPAAGTYLVTAFCQWGAVAGGNNRILGINKNGAAMGELARWVPPGAFSVDQIGADIVNMAANDYLEAYVFQDSGGNINITGGTRAAGGAVLTLSRIT